MIRALVISIGLCLAGTMSAQQIAQFTQYSNNLFGLNPAVAGSKDCIDMRIGYRTQWVGFEGAPKTSFANFHTRIFKKRAYGNGKHGLGVMVESDQMGPTANTTLMVAYAYHIPLNHKVWFSAGLYAGFQQYRFDKSKVTLANYNDDAVGNSGSAFLVPDFSPGVWLYNDDFYLGLSMRHMLMNDIKNLGTSETKLTHHYILVGGKKFKAEKGVSYIPSASVKFAPLSNPAIDLSLLVDYKNQIQFGATWRNTDAIAGMFKFRFLKYFSLGYSFDFTTSKIRVASSNTHEVILGIYACPTSAKSSYDCPAYN